MRHHSSERRADLTQDAPQCAVVGGSRYTEANDKQQLMPMVAAIEQQSGTRRRNV
jgi:hypothetical protein